MLDLCDRQFQWVDGATAWSSIYFALSKSICEEVYINEEAAVDAEQSALWLKIEVNEQVKRHFQRLVELGLWGKSVEDVAKALLEQSLAAKVILEWNRSN